MQKIRTRFKDLRQMCISIWPNKYHSFNYILDCLGLSEWMCNTIFHSEGEDGNFEDENLVEIYLLRGRCKKKNKEKKLTSVTYTPVKTKKYPFFPQAYMEIFEKCAKTQKRYLWLLDSPPLF